MNAFRRSSAVILISLMSALAQTSPNPYDPRLTFAPLSLPDPVNSYRSSNGAPGPSYWQNQADYEMHADLDTAAKTLKNIEVVTYTNNSPDSLPSLWLYLEQNIYRKDSRSRLMGEGRGRGADTRVCRAPTHRGACPLLDDKGRDESRPGRPSARATRKEYSRED